MIVVKDEGELLRQGLVLWRPYVSRGLQGSLDRMLFSTTPRGQFFTRMRWSTSEFFEPECQPAKERGGVVVFLPELPDQDWTHLEVENWSMRDKGRLVIFARFVRPLNIKSYWRMRSELYRWNLSLHRRKPPIEGARRFHDDVLFAPNKIRLVNYEIGTEWHYEHIGL
jgi:hypothetical protein